MIDGPSAIRVSLNGPTLTQLILLNPGMVVSIGIFLLFIGGQIEHCGHSGLSGIVTPADGFLDTEIVENW